MLFEVTDLPRHFLYRKRAFLVAGLSKFTNVIPLDIYLHIQFFDNLGAELIKL